MKLATFSRSLLLSSACLATLFVNASQTPKKDTKPMESKTAVTAKIAVLDIHRIVTEDPEHLKNSAPQWQELYAKIQDALKPLTVEFESLITRYKSQGAEFETMQKSGLSNQDALRRKYEELREIEGKLQGLDQKLQRTRFEEGNKAQAVIKRLLDDAVDAVQIAQGWDLVIMKDAVASRTVAKRFDITDEVLALLKNKHSAAKAAAPKKS